MMSISPEDLEFLQSINKQLQEGKSPEQIAAELDTPMHPSTLRTKIDRLGYEIESMTTRRLVPKRAPELDPAT